MKTHKTKKSATRKTSAKQKQLDREFARIDVRSIDRARKLATAFEPQTLKKSGKSAAQLDREIAEALGRSVGSGGLPMVQVKMDNGRPQVQLPPLPPPLRPQKVTLLVVTEPTRSLTFVYASRARALDEMKSRVTSPVADTTINIRTMDVIA